MTLGNGSGIRPQNISSGTVEVVKGVLQAVEGVNSEDEEDLFGRSSDEEEPDFVEETKDGDQKKDAADENDNIEGEFTYRGDVPEEAPIRRPANPADPTPEERERHNCTHLPYRPWCPICVKARGREDSHYKRTKEQKEKGIPKVCIDYAVTGENLDMSDERKMLCGRERWTQHTFAHLVSCKGLGDEKIVNKVNRSMRETGFTKMALKGDGEPALVQVQEAVKDKRNHETIVENPPAHDPQANGEAERAVQEVKAQMRCIKLGLEARIKKSVDARQPVMEWIIPHAADCINRFLIGEDGRTPHFRIHAKMFSAKVFEFGEQVLALPKRKRQVQRKTSLASRWHESTWLGFDTRSNEHIVAINKSGVAVKVRTLRPRPESQRWSAEAIENIIATPDAPNPKDPSQRAAKGARETRGMEKEDDAEGGHKLGEAPIRRQEGFTRNFRITDKLIEKFGYTPGCRGCEAKIEGTSREAHSAQCRQRLEEEMLNDEIERQAIERRNARRTQKGPEPEQAPLIL